MSRGVGSYGVQATALDTRQGRWFHCRLRYVWPAKQSDLAHAYCPVCGFKLRRTTHLLKWESKHVSAVRRGPKL